MNQTLLDYINQVEEATQEEMEVIYKRLLGCFAFNDTLKEVKETIENIFNVPVVKIELLKNEYKLVIEGHLMRTKLSAFGEALNILGEKQGVIGIAIDTVKIPLSDIEKLSPIKYKDEILTTNHAMERFC